MDHSGFNLYFVPCVIKGNNYLCSDIIAEHITPRTREIIMNIYSVVYRAYLTGRTSPYTLGRIDNTIACCCFDDGAFFFSVNANCSEFDFRGIFIKTDYLRSAWGLYQNELFRLSCLSSAVFERKMALDGFKQYGYFVMYSDDVKNFAEQAEAAADDKMKALLAEIALETAKHRSAPYNFIKTKLPVSIFPVVFKNTSSSDSSAALRNGVISFEREELGRSANVLKIKQPLYGQLRICRLSKKRYLDISKSELKARLNGKDAKATLEELKYAVNAYENDDEIWFLRLDRNNQTEFFLIDDPATKTNLGNGFISIYQLRSMIDNAISRKINKPKPVLTDIAEKEADPEPEKTQKKGLFGWKK